LPGDNPCKLLPETFSFEISQIAGIEKHFENTFVFQDARQDPLFRCLREREFTPLSIYLFSLNCLNFHKKSPLLGLSICLTGAGNRDIFLVSFDQNWRSELAAISEMVG
ncbi:MAG: hypothetical protein RMI90_03030, partial [Thermoguttaceae bacterium]|nr:hypothetical protein [Thermoguttaceae bacterium]